MLHVGFVLVCLLAAQVRETDCSPVSNRSKEVETKGADVADRLLGVKLQAHNDTRASNQAVYAWAAEEEQATGGEAEVATCRREDLFIDFAQIGMAEWVLAPTAYNAHRCTGHCALPLTDKERATNHAVMELMVRGHVTPSAASHQGPCCTPTKLAPLNVLILQDGHLVYKQLSDMTVLECGCQ